MTAKVRLPGAHLWRASVRFLIRHSAQTSFAVLGIALGVCVIFAVDIANISAKTAFQLSAQALTGKATHQISREGATLDEAIYVHLRRSGVRNIAPVVEGDVTLDGGPPRTLHIFGVDPLAESAFRGFGAAVGGESGLARLLTEPGATYISPSLAGLFDLVVDDTLIVSRDTQTVELRVVGTLNADNAAQAVALENTLLVDIATAQEVLGMIGALTRIDVLAEAGAEEDDTAFEWRSMLPTGVLLSKSNERSDALTQMTRAFHVNLTAMSLLALIVGMFIILNAMTFSVVRRRELFGTLRAMGTTRAQVLTLVLGEALVLGLLGTLIGLLLGYLVSFGLLGLVTQTINDLYFNLQVTDVHVAPSLVGKALLIGVLATVVAASLPALEATRARPRSVMLRSQLEQRVRGMSRRLVALGAAAMTLGVVVLFSSHQVLAVSFAGLFLVLVGYAACVPFFTLRLVGWLAQLVGGRASDLVLMALRGVSNGLSRTGVAMAALMVAVATMLGVATMIGSFRIAVDEWLSHSLRADIYLSRFHDLPGGEPAPIAAAVVESLRADPAVAILSRGARATVFDSGRVIQVLFLDVPRRGFDGYRFLAGDPDEAWRGFRDGSAVIVSEPYAFHYGVTLDDTLTLPTPSGVRSWRVAGVFRDYSSDRGVVVMHKLNQVQHWQNDVVTALGVYLAEGISAGEGMAMVRTRVAAFEALKFRDNATLRRLSLEVFDRTFAITQVLRLLTLLVAIVGIFGALMSLQLEKKREYAVMRALGITQGQLVGVVSMETAFAGLFAGVCAVPLGVALAWLLINVINQRSFGWSMNLDIDALQLVVAVLLSVASAIAAGLYPGLRLARISPAKALRNE